MPSWKPHGPASLDLVPIVITLELFVGKQLGVFGFAWATIRTGLADLPVNVTWLQLYGVSLLCGIGLRMSLFIELLAFPLFQFLQDESKIGVLAGLLLAGTVGWLILRFATPDKWPGAPS